MVGGVALFVDLYASWDPFKTPIIAGSINVKDSLF